MPILQLTFVSFLYYNDFITSLKIICLIFKAFECLKNVNIHLKAVEESASYYSKCGQVNGINEIIWAIKALQLTDLTTLAGDDTESNVRRLCIRAVYPFTDQELRYLDQDVKNKIHTAAVCVYPSRVHDAHIALKSLENGDKVEIAAGKIKKTLSSKKIKFKIHFQNLN